MIIKNSINGNIKLVYLFSLFYKQFFLVRNRLPQSTIGFHSASRNNDNTKNSCCQ